MATIRIHVVGGDGIEIVVTMNRSLPLKQLMDIYIEKTGNDKGKTRFLFDGQRLSPKQTPNELGMEDDETIKVVVEQSGGH
ncbi:Non-covalent complex between Ubc9 and Sumo1 [Neocallimastix lanati (nom. inval.)]|jgi:small ubiquitin-related modifier|uniref:Non-covalent complex between Ubc9 and Sumo1 n=1 Tax=Neocallimastix californiae TaxID=1754190 RepID=A0A1Y2EGZ4_9FUNG|nr:Non-covalent complex between Ubc9 and Sumo1 [Neocallimastix sp. JGI-2020a]ORY70839.1 Non-covalent complex between Ubc9 and Sumo1 [Neocallimastix californiae]|eukprot:ORY70839.1 Non-covalent complex between Ubc9 and Sumo1 [Neocallimastix californiae]